MQLVLVSGGIPTSGVYHPAMTFRTGCLAMLAVVFAETPTAAEVLSNQALIGKFFFRHVSLGTDGKSAANLSDSRSLMGTLTFDGKGGYTFVGQQVTGTGSPASQTGSGNYSI